MSRLDNQRPVANINIEQRTHAKNDKWYNQRKEVNYDCLFKHIRCYPYFSMKMTKKRIKN